MSNIIISNFKIISDSTHKQTIDSSLLANIYMEQKHEMFDSYPYDMRHNDIFLMSKDFNNINSVTFTVEIKMDEHNFIRSKYKKKG